MPVSLAGSLGTRRCPTRGRRGIVGVRTDQNFEGNFFTVAVASTLAVPAM